MVRGSCQSGEGFLGRGGGPQTLHMLHPYAGTEGTLMREVEVGSGSLEVGRQRREGERVVAVAREGGKRTV